MQTIDEKIKSSKQKLGEKIPCSIEVLTPVHVGSGVKLSKGIDFIKNDYSVHIVTQSELMKHLENDTEEMERFIAGSYKLSSLQKIPAGRRYNISIGRTSEINEFERNGNGKTYIPGSSIKGAIRTILLKKRFDELTPIQRNELLNEVKSNKKEWASEPVVKKLLGDDSNKNLMRVLEVFDAEFDDLDLSKVLVLTLADKEGKSYGWKRMGRDRKTNQPYPPQKNPDDATHTFVEALPIASKSYFSISLNSFLLKDLTAKNTLYFNEPTLDDIKQLVSSINLYSKQKLEKERDFFNKLNSPKKLTPVIKGIEDILNKINKLSNDEFILRISWGSGWKGMTGDYLDETWLNSFRRRYQLGKRDFPIFPKTRRIVFEDDEPKYLTGWVKVKLYESKVVSNNIPSNKGNNKQEIDAVEKLKEKFNVTQLKKKK